MRKRIHELKEKRRGEEINQKEREELEELREVLAEFGVRMAKAKIYRPDDFNALLARIADQPHARLIQPRLNIRDHHQRHWELRAGRGRHGLAGPSAGSSGSRRLRGKTLDIVAPPRPCT